MMAVLAASALLILFGFIMLITSAAGRRASEKADRELQNLYHAQAAYPTLTAKPAETEKPLPEAAETMEAPPQKEEMTAAADAPTPGPVSRLRGQNYPENLSLSISSRFLALREQNQDIIGWLTIGSMVDEAVVQRDNEYYMNHNASRQADVSGAIFLDARVSLNTRPYTLILYGHNMRTGARFGSLRNYENADFRRNYPFLSFNSIYEEGEYVIFSVGTVSTAEEDPNFLDFYGLASLRTDERQPALDTLREISLFTDPVDVQLDDQVLLLVTCADRDEERRIVAARRIRDGEDKKELKALAAESRKK